MTDPAKMNDRAEEPPALELKNITKRFALRGSGMFARQNGEHLAVDNVNLVVPKNKILGLVGESGSGKTTTGLMAMRLVEPSSGEILVNGTDISTLDHKGLKPFRRQMQIVFQDSYSALDPMMTLADIIAEPLLIHGILTSGERTRLALEWLERVGLDETYGGRYSHELSGGQRQRVAIARALILKPSVVVADEPTSALDVSVKAQIINLLQDLQEELGLSILFISHDLSVVRTLTDTVAVMYRGRIVERAQTEQIFDNAQHPYTRALLDAIPVDNPRDRRERIFVSAADLDAATPRYSVSDLAARNSGGSAKEYVQGTKPQLVAIKPGHFVEATVTS
jgi:oligopeptide/dipeptide ABC transporter ATP-binding protein